MEDYKNPLTPPEIQDIKSIAEELRLEIPDGDLQAYKDRISGFVSNGYSTLDKYADVTLPVKYPRTSVNRPPAEDNLYNAWYYKAEIQGAPDGILKGKKVVVKDCFQVAGVPMMHGSYVMEGYVPDYDPTVVTRVLDAGATIVGKATCEEFCVSGSSFTSKPAPVLNPHDKTRTSGGSSSGCAVLVQIGEADMALGGDQAGSVRLPASWTGVVAHKPTYGLVPYTALGSLSPAVDHCGPIARTVKDCALLLEAIAGDDDGRDPRQRQVRKPDELPKYSQLLTGDVSGKKIGLLKEGFDGCEPDVASLVKEAAIKLQDRGATVTEVSIPIHTDGAELVMPSLFEGEFHAMINSQGYCVGPPGFYPTSAIDSYFSFESKRRAQLAPTVKLRYIFGTYMMQKYGMHYYAKSQNILRLAKEDYNKTLDSFDVLLMPTIKFKAPKLPTSDLTVFEYFDKAGGMLANTAIFNGTGHPAISINAGFSEGLPVGMMIVGRHMEDDKLLNVAYAYEQLLAEGQ